MIIKIVLFTLAIILITDSLFVLAFPAQAKNMLKRMLKKNNLKKIVTWELIMGIIILVLSTFV